MNNTDHLLLVVRIQASPPAEREPLVLTVPVHQIAFHPGSRPYRQIRNRLYSWLEFHPSAPRTAAQPFRWTFQFELQHGTDTLARLELAAPVSVPSGIGTGTALQVWYSLMALALMYQIEGGAEHPELLPLKELAGWLSTQDAKGARVQVQRWSRYLHAVSSRSTVPLVAAIGFLTDLCPAGLDCYLLNDLLYIWWKRHRDRERRPPEFQQALATLSADPRIPLAEESFPPLGRSASPQAITARGHQIRQWWQQQVHQLVEPIRELLHARPHRKQYLRTSRPCPFYLEDGRAIFTHTLHESANTGRPFGVLNLAAMQVTLCLNDRCILKYWLEPRYSTTSYRWILNEQFGLISPSGRIQYSFTRSPFPGQDERTAGWTGEMRMPLQDQHQGTRFTERQIVRHLYSQTVTSMLSHLEDMNELDHRVYHVVRWKGRAPHVLYLFPMNSCEPDPVTDLQSLFQQGLGELVRQLPGQRLRALSGKQVVLTNIEHLLYLYLLRRYSPSIYYMVSQLPRRIAVRCDRMDQLLLWPNLPSMLARPFSGRSVPADRRIESLCQLLGLVGYPVDTRQLRYGLEIHQRLADSTSEDDLVQWTDDVDQLAQLVPFAFQEVVPVE